jgi:hypothetical protein
LHQKAINDSRGGCFSWYKLFMRRTLSLILVIIFLLALAPAASSAADPAAQTLTDEVASYTIAVTLDVDLRQLTGEQVITYRNTTQTPIPDLVFHLYLNGFRSADTIFMRDNGLQHRGFAFDPSQTGWIEVDSLRLAGGPALTLELLEDGTLARAALPQPVGPDETVELALTFTAQLPRVFARTGWAPDAQGDPFFLVGQWFPKLGVWQDSGWNAYPFRGNAEFFAEFGAYEVTITLPQNYVTGATGMPLGPPAGAPAGQQTITYRAEDVIDFAWTASPNLLSESRRVRGVEILYLYLPEHDWSVDIALDAAEAAFAAYSDWFGPYPYPRLTIVDVPEEGSGAGGMEYPTFVTAGAVTGGGPSPLRQFNVEFLVVHEVGHQWFQSMVATNEAEEPWLDEGFTDYASARLMIDLYGIDPDRFSQGRYGNPYLDNRRAAYLSNPRVPMYGPAWEFQGREYVIGVYAKPALSLLTLESVLGEDTMLELLSAYVEQWSFAHPTTEDFRALAEEISPRQPGLVL